VSETLAPLKGDVIFELSLWGVESGVFLALLGIVIGVWVFKKVRLVHKHRVTLKEDPLMILNALNLNDAKQSAYIITQVAQYYSEDDILLHEIVNCFEAFKYRPSVDALGDEELALLERLKQHLKQKAAERDS